MSHWSSTAARYFWKDYSAPEGGGEGAQTQFIRGTQWLSRPCTSRAACIFSSTNVTDISSNFSENLNKDSCLLLRHVLNTKKKKENTKQPSLGACFQRMLLGYFICASTNL